MDRFQSEPYAAPNSHCDRNEDGSPCYETFASSDAAEDDYEIVEMTTAMLAAIAAEEAEWYDRELARCPERLAIYMEPAGAIGEMSKALRAHELSCPRCGKAPAAICPQSESGRTEDSRAIA